jgi:outer membrane immunogenic protein
MEFLRGGGHFVKKKLAVATAAAVVAFAGSAYAADLELKAPPINAYNWTGLYGSLGAGWARSDVSWALTNPAPAGLPPFSAASNDGIVSGKVGYQYQFGFVVLGVEAGISSLIDQSIPAGPVGGGPGGCTANAGQLCQVHISAPIATVGGKLGFAWNSWLFYGEGGTAWSQVQSQYFTPPPGPGVFDPISQDRTGWYAGGGIDYVLLRSAPVDLIVGAEYRHVDLGSQFVQSPNGAANSRVIGAKEDSVLGRVTLKWNAW